MGDNMRQRRLQLPKAPSAVWGVVFSVSVGLLACVPPPNIRSIDPYDATPEEVHITLNQLEAIAANDWFHLNNDRYITGVSALLTGAVTEVIFLTADSCAPDVFGSDDCLAATALGIGVAGGLIGSGIAVLAIPTDRELELEALMNAEASDSEARRNKLERLYRYFDGERDLDSSVVHLLGSGILIGTGIAFVSVPAVYDDDDLDETFIVMGSIIGAVGVGWVVLAAVVREVPVYDLQVAPAPLPDGGGIVTIGMTF